MIDSSKLQGDTAPLIEDEDFRSWILLEDEDLLVLDKPGWVDHKGPANATIPGVP